MPSLVSAEVMFEKFRPERPKEEMALVSSKLLEGLSHVKTLKISGQGERPYPEDGDGWILEAVPQCLLLHLKRVDYYEFEGHCLEFDEDFMDGKEKKLLKRDNMSVAEDRISKLPDTLLHYILSFLPTKQVVATSVLSTTWTTLWTSVPKLDFSSRGYSSESARKFMNSIDRVLLSHNLSIIKKFSLSCSNCDNSRINAWLSAILKHKVQELNLSLCVYKKESIVLPIALFSCASLTVLILSSVGIVKAPSFISFPYLKILQLRDVQFFDECLTDSFSSFPVLEELSICNCKWINNSNKISISNPALKCLVLEMTDSYDGGTIDFFMMNAPSLVSLSWVSDYLPIECSLSSMPSLVSAKVIFQKFRPERPKEEMALVSSKLLEGLSHVKTLNISGQEDHMDVKKQKLLKQHNMSIAEDRISKLPNTVLQYLLSFLSTKDVVATCILSTRWRHVWTSAPNLDLSYVMFQSSSECARHFMNSVDRVLLFHNLSNIQNFSLKCYPECDDSRVSAWISAVVGHNVQELILDLGFMFRAPTILPLALFSCESLTVLKLSDAGVVKIPSSISFPVLKIFQLTSLKFFDECLTESFSSCPVLEELIIKNCAWINNSNKISISNPVLKRLVMESSKNLEGGNIDFFKMNAPSLVSLIWVGEYHPIECSVTDMPLLSSANVVFQKFHPHRLKEEISLAASKLLGALSHVKLLQISGQILFHAKDFLADLPEFENLLQLEVYKDFKRLSTRALLHLPRISPYLATLIFKARRESVQRRWRLDIRNSSPVFTITPKKSRIFGVRWAPYGARCDKILAGKCYCFGGNDSPCF
ncbi:hypothetical protein IFM89_035731 [Coptis chinensis]|uniref:F-box domain-containing protein n=1 Tax=Coptis chinensis TaxID=261450 RepID=A0A835H2E2_9MAGN|nr:hypothetical protein IFM89_035731 [Coptis chinensis]